MNVVTEIVAGSETKMVVDAGCVRLNEKGRTPPRSRP